jgi:hypothetical protein
LVLSSAIFGEYTLKKLAFILVVFSSVFLTSCAQFYDESNNPQFRPVASIQDIMLSIIDPNIDFVWNAVTTISTKEGIEEKVPETDEDWREVKKHALVVLEASNLLLIKGRNVAIDGVNTSTGGAELSAADIQNLINSTRPEFNKRALVLHDAMQLVIAAIDKKDPEELIRTGGLVEQACEQCHSQYWYPNDKRPN